MSNLSSHNASATNNPMYVYKRLTASGQIKATGGQLGGFLVATGTPTITIYDNTTATGTLILNGIVTVAGTSYPLPVGFGTGCFVTITGTCDVTFYYC